MAKIIIDKWGAEDYNNYSMEYGIRQEKIKEKIEKPKVIGEIKGQAMVIGYIKKLPALVKIEKFQGNDYFVLSITPQLISFDKFLPLKIVLNYKEFKEELKSFYKIEANKNVTRKKAE